MTDFSSVDRLMELGLGISLAQQMMNTMNYAMANTAVPGMGVNPGVKPVNTPGCEPPKVGEQKSTYFAVIDNAQVGPLDDANLRELIAKGNIAADSLMWRPGLNSWMYAKEIPDVNRWFYLK